MKRILAATDFSADAERALARAAQLAARLHVELVFCHALDWPSYAGPPPPSVAQTWRQAASEALQAAIDRHAGGTARALLLDGPLHRSLPAWLSEQPCDLLVLGAHGEAGWRDALLGSTLDRVLRAQLAPVLVARAEVRGEYARVAAAVDFSPVSGRVLGTLRALAPGAAPYLLHALAPPLENLLGFALLPSAELESYRREAAVEAQRHLQALAEAEDPPAIPTLRQGPPGRCLPDFVEEAGIELLALGSSGRSALERGLLGSVSSHAAASLGCDVLVV